MNNILLILVSIIPSIILGTIIYKQDKHGKEPCYLLMILVVAGILSVLLTLLIGEVLSLLPFYSDIRMLTSTKRIIILAFIRIALVEEFSKWIYLYLLTWTHKEFDHVYDAIVYSVFIALGFATIENIVYVMNSNLATGIMRAIISVPGQAFYGVMMGYYLAVAKAYMINGYKKMSIKYRIYSLTVPIILHGTFDALLLIDSIYTTIAFYLFVIFLYIIAIRKIRRLSKVTHNMSKETTSIV